MVTNTQQRGNLHSVTLAQLIKSYDFYISTSLRKTSAEGYRATLKQFLLHMGDEFLISQLSDVHIQGFLKARLDRGCAANTVRGDHRRLRAMFAWALEREFVPRNWAQMARPPGEEKPYKRSTGTDEFRTLLLFAADTEAEWRSKALLWLLYDTGMRIGECAALDRKDVDITSRTVRVAATSTKDKEERWIPFTDATAEAVHNYLTFQRGEAPGPLWVGARSQNPMDARALQQSLRKLSKRAKIPFSPHDLRRAFVSRCLAAGMPETYVMYLTGHSSPTMIQLYGRPTASKNAARMYREKMG